MGIAINPFQSSNCGININWPEAVSLYHSGKPLKNMQLSVNESRVPGEAVITDYGMEGSAVYQLVPVIRNLLNNNLPVTVHVDFKPSNTAEQLLQKTGGKNVRTNEYGQLFNLSPAQMAIIKSYTTKESFLSLPQFIGSIKNLAIPVESLRPVEEAISTVGGVDPGEVNDDFSLKKYPWIYVAGEMLDWDAPTGGFLIQGCFSMGHYAARSILAKE
jgi:predicted flavoprotein YhiN